jgi:uncharacterized repeat protein (TIGR01451 family)
MIGTPFSHKNAPSAWAHRARTGLRRKVACTLVYAILLTFLPWTPPSLTPAVERVLWDAPPAVQELAPLALTITGWADETLSALAPVPVYAGTNITLAVSKRDDGDSLGWPLGVVGPDPVVPGETFAYFYEITNTGSASATIVFTDILPVELACAGSAGALFSHRGGPNTYWLGSCLSGVVEIYTRDGLGAPFGPFGEGLPAGGHAVLYVQTTVRESLPDGHVFTNTQSSYWAVATQEPDTYSGRNDVTTTVGAPRLAIAKTAWPDPVEAGGEVTFTLAVSNSGRYTLTAPFTLTVVDRYPLETSYVRHTGFPNATQVEAGGSAITWTVPFTAGGNAQLTPGETLTATLVVTVDVPFTHTHHVTNAAYGVSIVPIDVITPTSASGPAVDVEVSSHPALTVTKGDAPDPVYASQEWTYWITLTNAADAQGNAVGLVITDRVPLSTELRSVSYAVAGTTVVSDGAAAGSVITWTLPAAYSLFWGESTHVSFTVGSAASVVVSPTVITNALYGAVAANSLAGVSGDPITTTLWGAPYLEAAKLVEPSAITAANDTGDVITFTIAVTNLDSATANATGVVITDSIPLHTELLSAGFAVGTGTVYSPSPAAGSTITWALASPLAPAERAVLTFTVHVSTPVDDGTAIQNRAFALSSEGVHTESNQVDVTVWSTPTLHVTKLESTDPISADGVSVLTYTIYYTNSGTMNAYGTVLSDTLPENVAFVAASGSFSPPSPLAGQVMAWDLGTVWGSGSVQLALTVTHPITNGTVLTNQAEIACQADKYTRTAPLTTAVRSWPVLALTKSEVGGADPISAGTYLTYEIVILNAGFDWARDLVLTDLVPENTTLISTSLRSEVTDTTMISSGVDAGETITWEFGSYLLPVGEPAHVTFTVLVHSWLTNGMSITNATYLADASNALSAVSGPEEPTEISSYPRLSVGKGVQPPSVKPGDIVTYTITVVNRGNDSSRDTRVTDTLPAGIAFGGMLDGPAPTSVAPEVWSGLYITGAITRVTGYTPTVYTLRFTATVDGAAAEGDYTNVVTVTDQYGRETTASRLLRVYYPAPAVHKSANSGTVVPGDAIAYTIHYTNESSTPAHGVVLTDVLPLYITGGSASPPPDEGTIGAGNVLTWNLGTLAGYEARTITLNVDVTSPLTNGTVLTDRVGITSAEGFGETGAPVEVVVVSQPDLALAKDDLRDPVTAGSVITYRIHYTHTLAGTDWARNAVLSDTLPEDIVGGWASVVPDGGTIAAGSTVTWGLGTLAPGEDGSITLWLTTAASIADGTVLTNRASISCDEGVLASAWATTTISSSPLLQAAKSDQRDPVQAGETISYTILYTNAGNGPAAGAVLSDLLPAGSFDSGWAVPPPVGGNSAITHGATVVWDLGVLPGGGTTGTVLLYLVTTSPLDAPVALTNRVTIAAAGGFSATASASTGIECSPDITVVKAVDAPVAVPGSVRTYTVTATNLGNQNAAGPVVLTDLLPLELSVVGMSPSVGTVLSDVVGGQSALTWTLPSLAGEGGSAQLVLGVEVTRPLTNGLEIANTAWLSHGASITASEPVTFAVVSAPDLQITKSGPSQARPADLISYTVAVTNAGTEAAYGVRITDVVPANTTFDSASDGGQESGGVVSWTLDMPLLDVGYTRVFTVRLDTPLDDGTQILNTAWVSHGGALTESNQVAVTVVSTPALHIEKSAYPDPAVSVGGLLTYTITYSNSGDMRASGVVVTDTVDANVTVVNTIPPSDTMVGPAILWSLPPLEPGVPGQITVVVRVTDTLVDNSVITNVAEIGSNQGKYAATGPVTTTVRAADVAVSKHVTPALARPGESVTYTILFTNVGGIEASSVEITDDLPISLTLVSSGTMGVVFAGASGNSYRWVTSVLPVGGGGAITISAQVTTAPGWIQPAGTAITNVVTSATSGDNAPGNDVDRVPVTVIAGPAATITLGISPPTVQVPGPATAGVTVTDQYGNLVANVDAYTVTLSGSAPVLGLAPVTVTIVDGTGTAAVTTTVAATYDVTGVVGSDGTISATAPVTFVPGNLYRFVIGAISTQTAGISFTVDITAVDAYSNVATGFNGTAPLADGALPNTLQPPATGPFVDGVLVGQDVTITLARVGTPILVGTGLTQTASNPFTVTAGAPGAIDVVPGLADIPLGVDAPVTATVRDAYGNLVPGTVLTFGVSLGTAVPLTGVAGAGGWAGFAISSTVLGPATVVVTASNQVTGSVPVTFVAGYPALITVTIVPSSTSVDNTAAITVEVVDAYGYPVTWGSIGLSTPDPLGTGAIVPPVSPLDGNGRAMAAISSSELGRKTVTATAGANGQAGAGVVTFTVGAPGNVVVDMFPNPQAVGVDATLVATVTDQYGHPVPGEVITFTVIPGTLGGGGIAPDTGTAGAQGAATTTITSTVASGSLVTATVASNTAVSNTAFVDFVAGAPAYVTVRVSPVSVDGGINATLVATVTDRFSNRCGNIPITFTSDPLGGGGIWPDVWPTDSGGVATAQISGTIPGPVVITATVSPVVSDTTVLTIASGLLDHLEASAVPDPLVAGADFTLVITAVDALGTPRAASGLVTISDATGTVAPTTVSLVNGTATLVLSITMAYVGDQISLVLDAPPGIMGATNLFTVTSAAPFTIALTATPASISPNGDTSTLVAAVEDVYGNRVPGWTVDFAQVAGPSVTLSPVSGTTDAGGQVTVTLISGVNQGTATIEATSGGVTASVDVEISTYFIYLPLVVRNFVSAPDLVVDSVNPTSNDVVVVVRNQGVAAVQDPFWIDAYIDPDTPPTGANDIWEHVGSQGIAWIVEGSALPLAPGGTLTLRVGDAHYVSAYSNVAWPLPEGTTVYAQVDSAYAGVWYGAVLEGHEISGGAYNNIVGPVLSTLAVDGASEPTVRENRIPAHGLPPRP